MGLEGRNRGQSTLLQPKAEAGEGQEGGRAAVGSTTVAATRPQAGRPTRTRRRAGDAVEPMGGRSRGGATGARVGLGEGGGTLVLLAVLLAAGRAVGHGDGAVPERYPETNLGNRSEGPGFAAPVRPGSWIQEILPPIFDPAEPLEHRRARVEEARRSWRRTDPYYRWSPGDTWLGSWDGRGRAVGRREGPGGGNEPNFPILRIPEEAQGFRVPWDSSQDRGPTSFAELTREDGPLRPLFLYRLSPYLDAITADIDELARRRRNWNGHLRTGSWWTRAAQTDRALAAPQRVPEANVVSVLHRNHLQGPAPRVYYIPPRVHRPGQQEPGYPREIWSSGRRWHELGDHEDGNWGGPEVGHQYEHRTRAREEGNSPGPYAIDARDRETQTPLGFDPRLRGQDQHYPLGPLRRISGRLYEDIRNGDHFIAPADPRSTRSGSLHDRFVEAGDGGAVWWEYLQQSNLARLHTEGDGQSGVSVAREPEGQGYSGDEEEERRTPRPPRPEFDDTWSALAPDESDEEEIETIDLTQSSEDEGNVENRNR